MRPLVTAFLLGLLAFGIVGGAAVVAVAIVADAAGWHAYRVALGPLLVTDFERDGTRTAASFGPGLILIGLAGGILNVLGAALLVRRGN